MASTQPARPRPPPRGVGLPRGRRRRSGDTAPPYALGRGFRRPDVEAAVDREGVRRNDFVATPRAVRHGALPAPSGRARRAAAGGTGRARARGRRVTPGRRSIRTSESRSVRRTGTRSVGEGLQRPGRRVAEAVLPAAREKNELGRPRLETRAPSRGCRDARFSERPRGTDPDRGRPSVAALSPVRRARRLARRAKRDWLLVASSFRRGPPECRTSRRASRQRSFAGGEGPDGDSADGDGLEIAEEAASSSPLDARRRRPAALSTAKSQERVGVRASGRPRPGA
jgi:hypothetical protein